MYTLKSNEIFRNEEAIASVKDGKLDFYEGMAKFRAPAVRFYNTLKDEKNEDTDVPTDTVESVEAVDTAEAPVLAEEPTPKEEEAEEKEDEGEKSWIDVLSAIVGQEVPMPHPKNGWRLTKLRPLLLKHYDSIVASKELDNATKKLIINYFM